jgi:hypothetical protein
MFAKESAAAKDDDDDEGAEEEAERVALMNEMLGASLSSMASTSTTAELQSSFSSLFSSSGASDEGGRKSRSSSRGQRGGRRRKNRHCNKHRPSLVEAARALEVPSLPAELFADNVELFREEADRALGVRNQKEEDIQSLLSILSAAETPPQELLEVPPLPAQLYGGDCDVDILSRRVEMTAASSQEEEDIETLLSILSAAETPPPATASESRPPLPHTDSAPYELILVPLPPSTTTSPPSSSRSHPLRPLGGEASWPVVVCQCCYEEIEPSSTMQVFTCTAISQTAGGGGGGGGAAATSNRAISRGQNQQHPHSVCAHCLSAYVKEWVFGGTCYPLRQRPRHPTVERRVEVTTPSLSGLAPPSSYYQESYNSSLLSLELPCLSPDCTLGTYPRSAVEQALASSKVLRHYDEKMARAVRLEESKAAATTAVVAAASLGAPSENAKGPNTYPIQRTGSALSSSHHRRNAEKALTERSVRRCPVCHAPVIKELQTCHKIRCANCDFRFCYLCRSELPAAGYDHFCRHKYDFPCDECRAAGITCYLWSREEEPQQQSEPRDYEEGDAATAAGGGGGGGGGGEEAVGRNGAGCGTNYSRRGRRRRLRIAARARSDGAGTAPGLQSKGEGNGDKDAQGDKGEMFWTWKKLRSRRRGNF